MSVIWLWIGFIVFIIAMLALDLGVFHRKAHVPSLRESLAWTIAWILVALAFNVGIYFIYEHHLFGIGQPAGKDPVNGAQAAKLFLTGYLIEKSLSLDNIFVIGMVFSFFAVPRKYQHRVLFWGILGAIVLRAIMILLGVALIQMFQWMLYVFGALLLITAIKMLLHRHEEIHPENNPLVKLAQRFFRMTSTYHADRFFVKENGLWAVTPMFLVLLVVESYDVIFAIDSIPAIFAITQDPFIVFTSNIFAILGLRSLYFVMAAMIAKFRYLKISLSVILVYVGVKLLAQDVIHHFEVGDVVNWVSLGVIIFTMLAGVLVSIWVNKHEHKALEANDCAFDTIQNLSIALDRFQGDVGRYPTTEEGLAALMRRPGTLVNPDAWRGPYFIADDSLLDPWGQPYQYVSPGVRYGGDFELWSLGPDQIDGTDDDIGNWNRKTTDEAKEGDTVKRH